MRPGAGGSALLLRPDRNRCGRDIRLPWGEINRPAKEFASIMHQYARLPGQEGSRVKCLAALGR
jgi:hypothetical protein